MIRRLDDAPSDQIGGKAAGLRRLVDLGLPVPPAVVIPAADHGGMDDPGGLLAGIPEPLAVRSSAVEEDTVGRSAAGQFETVLNVSREDLSSAVEHVLRSATSDRARAYTGGDARMAVVIQQQVEASRSGVAFSHDPMSGGADVFVECVFGPGERLVSGAADPDRYWVESAGTVRARLAIKPEPWRLLRTLRDDEVQRVAEMTRRAEHGMGRPVDVEFCFEGPELWLVQCRPITAVWR